MTGNGPMGWCPGVFRPMPVADGLLIRIRPHLARLTKAQVFGVCEVAETCGNGLVELTTRANLQIRGVREGSHAALLDGLARVGLLDPDPETERRRSILVTPFWRAGDESHVAADALAARLDELPDLPAKFGFVIDLGTRPVLGGASGDIRLERGEGCLVVRADGMERGRAVDGDTAIDALIELGHWFSEHQTADRRRMAHVVVHKDLPSGWSEETPLLCAPEPECRSKGLIAVPEGPFPAATLRDLVDAHGAGEIRLTPWRMVCVGEVAALDGAADILQSSLRLPEVS